MSPARALDRALLALAVLGSGTLALRLGQDVNFDQLQYHVYLGWSLVAGRFDKDIAPAGLGGYFNPLLHVPSYLGLTYLPPRVFSFLLAAVQGLNAFLAYRLARLVLRGLPHEQPLAALAGLVAATGPCAVSLLGTTFTDNMPSLLVLGSLLFLCAAAEEPRRMDLPALGLAGLLGGAAAGLKLTFLAYAVGLAAAAAVVAVYCGRLRSLVVFAAGGLAGAILTGGYWGLKLWHRFRNPIFPFANSLFRSPYIQPEPLSDPNWAVRGWSDLLMPPLDLALGRTGPFEGRLLEIAARDTRYLILFVLLAAFLARLAWRGRGRETPSPVALVVVTAWLAGYAAWVWTFHYYRYFAAGEFIAPAVILALLRLLAVRRLAIVWTVIASAIVLTTASQSWNRMVWSDRPLHIPIPLPASREGAVVLVAGPYCSYTLPSFPSQTRFFGILGTTPKLDSEVVREVERHRGPFYLLIGQNREAPPLDRFALVEGGPCSAFRTGGRGRFRLCPLERVSR